MLDKLQQLTATDSNIEFLNELSRELTRVAGDPKAVKELADEIDKFSKVLYERPKAKVPASPEEPGKTKDEPKPAKAEGVVWRNQYGEVVDSETPKESK